MDAPRSTLLITYLPEILDGFPILISSNCLPVKASKHEPAGRAFHAAALRLSGYEEEDANTDDQSVKSDDKRHSYIPSSDSYSTKGKKKSGNGSQQQDHYALLGLAHLRFLATEEQIRKSYRETALKHHPDKQASLLLAEVTEKAKQVKKDEIESHFKSIQEAYEILIDPVKRRVYDSTDEFDDEVPNNCAPQDFFKVFGPAFMRNGRWSVTTPVPSLGDDKTPLGEVDSFYNFWYSFKSWREFPHADEFELEQAESRDHKRWMERQNAKLREKAKKEEHVRIRMLIDNAYKKDPRILRRKEEVKAEKQRKKDAKVLAKKLQEEEAARAVEEERRKKEEDDRRAFEVASNQRKQREKEKKLLRKEKSRLRTLSSSVVSTKSLGVSDDDVEKLCTSLKIDQLRLLCDRMEEEGSERAQLLRSALGMGPVNPQQNGTVGMGPVKPQQNGTVGRGPVNPQHNGTVGLGSKMNGVFSSVCEKKEKPWGKEEVEKLRKGMQKYPKGTLLRWEVVSEYIGTGRSIEEILKATKTVLLEKPDTAKAFDSFLEKRKPAPPVASPLTTRLESEGLPVAAAPPETVEKRTGNGIMNNGVSSDAEQDVWSAIQEGALVQALKTFPKEASQRWERVAAAVPGKTVNQCRKKFATMKKSFQTKKNAD